MTKNKFHTRSFVSFLLFLSIIWLLVSGTVLYIAPPGRVAHWQHWTLFGFGKDQWQAQHTIFSYLFVIIAGIHIFSLNWRNLWSYVKLKTRSGFRKKKEFFVATILTFILFFGTSFDLPPFSSFYELGESIGFSWEEKQRKAPIPHTENLTLSEISSNHLHIDIEEVIGKLKRNGVSVKNESQTLKEIAIENGKSPADIYSILVPQAQRNSYNGNSGRGSSGKGYGRMTIKEVAEELNVDVSEIISLLESNRIEAKPKQTIRDIAAEHDLHPSEIVRMIRGDH